MASRAGDGLCRTESKVRHAARACSVLAFCCCLTLQVGGLRAMEPLVIAHRGASGYLPEHTLAAKALAVGMGADYLEQDVVLSRDGQAVVLHDIHLDTVTDVATVFPQRARADGRYYAIDFSLAELKTLSVHERIDLETAAAVYPQRYPIAGAAQFRIPTLSEELEFVAGLRHSTGRRLGVYPEVKAPRFHRQAGHDISREVLRVLAEHGYRDREDPIYLQCFDAAELRRIRGELGCELKLVQLIGENSWGMSATDYDQLQTEQGVVEIARYADGIGPRIEQVIGADGEVLPLVRRATAAGLAVHPYTFRRDALAVPGRSPVEILELLFQHARVNGLFTDFSDLVVDYVRQHPPAAAAAEKHR